MLYELFIFIVTFFAFFAIGELYDRFFLKSVILKYDFSITEQLFFKVLVGVFVSVSTIACLKSNFTSLYLVFFLFFVLAPFLFFKKIHNQSLIQKKNKLKVNHLILGLVVLTFFFYHQFLFVYNHQIPFYDFLFLSKISSGLIANGTESFYSATSGYYGVDLSPHLYHYFDLWFTGIISEVFNYSEYNVLLYITFPFFHVLVFFALYIIFKHSFKSFSLSLLLSFGFLFGSKFFLTQQGGFIELIETYRGLPYSLFYKLLMIYLLVLLAYYFYLKRIFLFTTISICSLLIIYPTTIPAFFFLAIMIFVYELIKTKKVSYFSISIFTVIIYMVLFQKLLGFDKMADLTFYKYSIKQYAVLFIESLIKIFIEHYLTLLLILIVTIKYFRLMIRNRIIIYVVISIIGSILYVYFNPPGIRDLNQIISNVSPVLLLVLSIELIRFFKISTFLKSIIALTLVIGCYNVYLNFSSPNIKLLGKENHQSIVFTSNVEKFVIANKDANFCSISTFQPFDYYYHTSMKFNYILKLKEIKTPLEIKILFDGSKRIYDYGVLNKYYPPNLYFHQKNNSNSDIYNYLKMNRFNYLLVENSSNNRTKDFLIDYCKLILKDENTNDALYSIN